MKRMGVLGGISPQATMDFEARVHRISQHLIPQAFNEGYPPMVVWYHRRPPIRSAITPSRRTVTQARSWTCGAMRRAAGKRASVTVAPGTISLVDH